MSSQHNTSPFRLVGKTALVTGGAQGIGFAISYELARAGGRPIIADRDLEGAIKSANEITHAGWDADAVALDVTDENSVRNSVQVAIERYSQLDILVNNAGIHCEKIGEVSTPEHFNKCFDVNLLGVWRMVSAIVPIFRAQHGGKIINIASINGRRAWADTPAYSASKAALINLTQSLAKTLGPDNINVNAICPGGIMTAMAKSFISEIPELETDIISPRALKRPLVPADIGHAVVFFASECSRNITGQALNVDGGDVMV